MSTYGLNDYDTFLQRDIVPSSLEELLTEIEGGDTCEKAFERPIPEGIVNDRYEIIKPNTSTTILYDRIAKERVFVSDKSRKVLAKKIKEHITTIKQDTPECDYSIHNDCAQFLREAWDAEQLYDLEQTVSGEGFDGTRWEGTITIGTVNYAYEIVQEGEDYIVIDHNNEDERFNISRCGIETFLSTIRTVLEDEYCHGLDYHSYCALQDSTR